MSHESINHNERSSEAIFHNLDEQKSEVERLATAEGMETSEAEKMSTWFNGDPHNDRNILDALQEALSKLSL
jgi:hypothetical protein